MKQLSLIREAIKKHPDNAVHLANGYGPLFSAHPSARIVIVGQAPGIRAQQSMVPWNDKSGMVLREWLGLSDRQFYDEELISILPMDFYYPGKGMSGDLPPRKDFAALWHPQILACMESVQLTVLVGAYAQKHYLGKSAKKNLTQTVSSFEEYLPEFLPIVHPSPLNFRWQAKNPWFKQQVVPALKSKVKEQTVR